MGAGQLCTAPLCWGGILQVYFLWWTFRISYRLHVNNFMYTIILVLSHIPLILSSFWLNFIWWNLSDWLTLEKKLQNTLQEQGFGELCLSFRMEHEFKEPDYCLAHKNTYEIRVICFCCVHIPVSVLSNLCCYIFPATFGTTVDILSELEIDSTKYRWRQCLAYFFEWQKVRTTLLSNGM